MKNISENGKNRYDLLFPKSIDFVNNKLKYVNIGTTLCKWENSYVLISNNLKFGISRDFIQSYFTL